MLPVADGTGQKYRNWRCFPAGAGVQAARYAQRSARRSRSRRGCGGQQHRSTMIPAPGAARGQGRARKAHLEDLVELLAQQRPLAQHHVQRKAQHERAVAHVAEHDREQERERHDRQHRRVDLAVLGHAVRVHDLRRGRVQGRIPYRPEGARQRTAALACAVCIARTPRHACRRTAASWTAARPL